jgi:hypothetical protein
MGMNVYWTTESASKPHEVEFFPEFIDQVGAVFEHLKLDGVLIGWPRYEGSKYFQPDALIITKNVVLVVDFKKVADHGETLRLPPPEEWESREWLVNKNQATTMSSSRVVNAGHSSINPFVQIRKQQTEVAKIMPAGVKVDIRACVLVQGNPTIAGRVPGRFNSFFKIATQADYPRVIADLLNTDNFSGKINAQDIVSKLSVTPYEEVLHIKQTVAHIEERLDSEAMHAKQRYDELALKLQTVEAAILAEHQNRKGQLGALARQEFDSLSVEQTLLLQQMELASRDFVAAREAEVAKNQTRLEIARVEQETAKQLASARRAEARIKKHDAELTKQSVTANRKGSRKTAYIVAGSVALIASIGFLTSQQPWQVGETGANCIQLSEIPAVAGSLSCVEFTPQDSNTEYANAYLNDIKDFENGVFFVQINEWEKIYENKSEITDLEGDRIRVSGNVTKVGGKDGKPDRYKIVVTSTSQIQR